jgi:5-methylthioribose kinase
MIDVENVDELIAYLRDARRISPNETPTVRSLSGGVSNKTLLVTRSTGESWVIKQALSKLRVESDWFSNPARIQVEANGLRHLPRVAPEGTITPLIFADNAQSLLAMKAVPQPHQNWKVRLLDGQIEPRYFRRFAEIIASIHRESTRSGSEFSSLFAAKEYFQTLRLEPYYEHTATVVPEAASFLNEIVQSTLSRSHALVHGDASPKNVLIHNDRLILLDHEVLHFGDPAFDIGFSLTHFLSKALHLPNHRRQFEEAARLFWNTYRKLVDEMPWFTDLIERAPKHTLASLLARVCGRSPLEYLGQQERLIQKKVVIDMIGEDHSSLDDVITGFVERISVRDTNEPCHG